MAQGSQTDLRSLKKSLYTSQAGLNTVQFTTLFPHTDQSSINPLSDLHSLLEGCVRKTEFFIRRFVLKSGKRS